MKRDSGPPSTTERASRDPARTISYHRDALAFMEGNAPKKIRRQIKEKIDSLLSNPKPPGHKKLDNVSDDGDDVFRIRSGDYRVIYALKANNEILVLDIGDRKDIYRRWKSD